MMTYRLIYNFAESHIVFLTICIWLFSISLLFWKQSNGDNQKQRLAFGLYILVVFYVTFISRKSGSQFGIITKWYVFNNEKNLIYIWHRDWEDICNIFLFLPIGVFFHNLAARKLHWYGCILFGACLSAFIEIMQYTFRCGYCDINDFIHNVIGTACGYFMGRLVQTLFKIWRRNIKCLH